jgi:hypothetical protein
MFHKCPRCDDEHHRQRAHRHPAVGAAAPATATTAATCGTVTVTAVMLATLAGMMMTAILQGGAGGRGGDVAGSAVARVLRSNVYLQGMRSDLPGFEGSSAAALSTRCLISRLEIQTRIGVKSCLFQQLLAPSPPQRPFHYLHGQQARACIRRQGR